MKTKTKIKEPVQKIKVKNEVDSVPVRIGNIVTVLVARYHLARCRKIN